MEKLNETIINEYERKNAFVIGYASGLFCKYILSDKKRFGEFLKIVSEEDKNKLLTILMLQDINTNYIQ